MGRRWRGTGPGRLIRAKVVIVGGRVRRVDTDRRVDSRMKLCRGEGVHSSESHEENSDLDFTAFISVCEG